jgi:hypothetical protein
LSEENRNSSSPELDIEENRNSSPPEVDLWEDKDTQVDNSGVVAAKKSPALGSNIDVSMGLLKGYIDFFKDSTFPKREFTKGNMITGALLILASAIIVAVVTNVYMAAWTYKGFSLRGIDTFELIKAIIKSFFFTALKYGVLAGAIFGTLRILKKDTDIQENVTVVGFVAGFSTVFTVISVLFGVVGMTSSIQGMFATAASLLPFAVVLTYLTQTKELSLRLAVNTGVIIFIAYNLLLRLI